MSTPVQEIDVGRVWVPLETLRDLTRLDGEATLVPTLLDQQPAASDGWVFRDVEFLLSDLREMVAMKSVGSAIMYAALLILAMLAIFDTQILSVFRRRKEMGTLMALGMTRWRIIRLFTIEGALHAVLAACVAAAYGLPLLWLTARNGIPMPEGTDAYGFAVGDAIIPVYGAGLILGTTLIVLVTTTVVSFLPTRRIARLKPTDALRGKFS
jgi:ABC-type antimicrobial peptide transport system permease subunit